MLLNYFLVNSYSYTIFQISEFLKNLKLYHKLGYMINKNHLSTFNFKQGVHENKAKKMY